MPRWVDRLLDQVDEVDEGGDAAFGVVNMALSALDKSLASVSATLEHLLVHGMDWARPWRAVRAMLPSRPVHEADWGGDPLRLLAIELVDLMDFVGPVDWVAWGLTWKAWRRAELPGMPPVVQRARLGWLVVVRGEVRRRFTRTGAIRLVHAAALAAETRRIRALPGAAEVLALADGGVYP